MIGKKTFPLGSKVKQTAGNIIMTVVGYEAEFDYKVRHRNFNHAICCWKDGASEYQAIFHVSILEAVL